jgi:hypothetical protein
VGCAADGVTGLGALALWVVGCVWLGLCAGGFDVAVCGAGGAAVLLCSLIIFLFLSNCQHDNSSGIGHRRCQQCCPTQKSPFSNSLTQQGQCGPRMRAGPGSLFAQILHPRGVECAGSREISSVTHSGLRFAQLGTGKCKFCTKRGDDPFCIEELDYSSTP